MQAKDVNVEPGVAAETLDQKLLSSFVLLFVVVLH